MRASLPPDEADRIRTLRDYEILDTPAERGFDDLALLAAHICQVPIALVSLVDESRQWFKSRIGVSAAETSRDIAFCAHTILHKDEVLEVRDAEADPRFSDSTLVTTDPHVRFYAGAPLVAPNGHALGALCVMDRAPRTLTADQLDALRALSRSVVAQLEMRRQARELASEAAERKRAESSLQEQFEQLSASKAEADRLLGLAHKSRRALLSVLEDEKLAGHRLQTSEERFRQLAENIHEVFWMTDPSFNEILYVSPAYERIWGRTAESLYRAPEDWVAAIHPEDRQRVLEAVLANAPTGNYDEIYRIQRPDGSLRWIRDRGFPVRDEKGDVYRIVGTAEDISDQRQLEAQLRQAQKLEAMGTLAGGIAHDFNNILGAIIGYAELARLEAKGNAQLTEYIRELIKAGRRAADLVKQILTFSRHQEQERVPIQARHVIAEAIKLLRAATPTTIGFNTSLANDTPTILADGSQIHQIVMNLGTNAAHAMKDRPGLLETILERVTVDSKLAAMHSDLRPGLYARLSIRDTGHGMDRLTIERIFEPFFTTKPPGEGTGLGLAVVHGIMQAHGGCIVVHSQPGEGTRFQMYFPAISDAKPEAQERDYEPPRGNGERILLVDDEESLIKVGHKMFESLGYAVTSTANPMTALSYVVKQPNEFDVVITDLTMPEMTGIDLGKKLLAINPNMPIILATGYSATLTQESISAMGFREILLKPLTISSVAEAIKRVLK